MQKNLFIIWFITIILVIVLFPKKEKDDVYLGVENEYPYIEVTIVGEVYFPGTYTFFKDITYKDVIDQAGGLTINANTEVINYQKAVTTNTTITIESKEKSENDITIMVNINEASFADLLTIPYMTETKAANIIIYREKNGAFKSIEDLVLVKYIGTATLEKIRPYITI